MTEPSRPALVLIANARMPSQRAQSLQVAQAAASFARAGVATTLLYARRKDTPGRSAQELWDHYAVPDGARPDARAIGNIDFIDAVPRKLQYGPARMQELAFARGAARVVKKHFMGAIVISREIEAAHRLKGRRRLFLEVHRVPGGNLRRRWLTESAERAAGVIAISGGVKSDLVELGLDPEAILVEHDAYDPGRFDELPARAEARAALDVGAQEPLVVYTGGLLEWKGVDVLVEAARALPAVRFLIAGGMDEDVVRLRERAQGLSNVRIDGFRPPREVANYLAAADVGVVPNRARPAISARYTSPLKVFEALAAGLPLVVSDLPSLREILTEREAAFVPPEDPASLAAVLDGLLKDADRRAAMSQAQKVRASGHTWDARAQRLLAWMEARS